MVRVELRTPIYFHLLTLNAGVTDVRISDRLSLFTVADWTVPLSRLYPFRRRYFPPFRLPLRFRPSLRPTLPRREPPGRGEPRAPPHPHALRIRNGHRRRVRRRRLEVHQHALLDARRRADRDEVALAWHDEQRAGDQLPLRGHAGSGTRAALFALGKKGYPVHYIIGTDEQAFDGPAMVKTVQPHFTKFTVLYIEKGGHSVFHQNTQQVIESITQFVNNNRWTGCKD